MIKQVAIRHMTPNDGRFAAARSADQRKEVIPNIWYPNETFRLEE